MRGRTQDPVLKCKLVDIAAEIAQRRRASCVWYIRSGLNNKNITHIGLQEARNLVGCFVTESCKALKRLLRIHNRYSRSARRVLQIRCSCWCIEKLGDKIPTNGW